MCPSAGSGSQGRYKQLWLVVSPVINVSQTDQHTIYENRVGTLAMFFCARNRFLWSPSPCKPVDHSSQLRDLGGARGHSGSQAARALGWACLHGTGPTGSSTSVTSCSGRPRWQGLALPASSYSAPLGDPGLLPGQSNNLVNNLGAQSALNKLAWQEEVARDPRWG